MSEEYPIFTLMISVTHIDTRELVIVSSTVLDNLHYELAFCMEFGPFFNHCIRVDPISTLGLQKVGSPFYYFSLFSCFL